MRRLICAALFLTYLVINNHPLYAGLYFHYGFNIDNFVDSESKYTFSTMKNLFFMGAFIGPSKNIVFGQNVIYWSKLHQNQSTDPADKSGLSILELGPRFILYMGEQREYFFSATYHPYVKGTRQIGATDKETISGSSYVVTIGYHLKVTKTFFLGGSLNYHGMTITESTVGTETETVSYAYSTYYPMLEFSLRF